MKSIKKSRDITDQSNQLCRLGLTNDNALKTLIDSIGTSYVTAYIQSKSGSRRKRSASDITCTDINNLSGSLNSLTTTQLNTISNNDFTSCQTVLGLASNSWSTNQLSTLATKAKSVYSNNVASISDSNLISLNSILIGFSTTDLGNLVFTSTNSIQALGSLNGWSTDQVKLILIF